MIVIEVIPYRTFKEKIKLVKEHLGQGKIEVYKSYIYIEREEKND
ncbi:hypothetical protein [Clostridium sp. HMP27]|nr:hypothetical protein [Clostridium sp. HMP27]